MIKSILFFFKKIFSYVIPLLVFPVCVFICDPFDYFSHQFRLEIDRIHIVRQFNVADWAIVEVSKLDKRSKSKVNIVSIGDSRGRALMSGPYKNGWKGRMVGENSKHYDLSFGSAQIDENFSLLDKELKYLDSLETIVIVLPIDKLLTYKRKRNRIESSKFYKKGASIRYLFNLKQLYYLFGEKRINQLNIKEESKQKHMKKNFLNIYEQTSEKIFEENLSAFMLSLSKLDLKFHLKIVIPPYEKSFFKEIITYHKEDYEYYLNRISETMTERSISVINLQPLENNFYFVDPIHGFNKKKNSLLKLIFN